jgi:hypothetical protein
VSLEKANKELIETDKDKLIKAAYEILESEVKTYNQYLY